jgi:hypothetical protein
MERKIEREREKISNTFPAVSGSHKPMLNGHKLLEQACGTGPWFFPGLSP